MNFPSTSIEETIERICCLPVSASLRGNASLMALVEETSYGRFEREIDAGRLRSAIGDRVGLVDAWLTYSATKSENWGWFFEGPHKGIYLVGCRTSYSIPPRPFNDAFDACAYFIKMEIQAIRGG